MRTYRPEVLLCGIVSPCHCSLAYSKIHLSDVAARLHIPSVEEAECIVAKAIRDGAIDATIDYESKAMVSRETQVCTCLCVCVCVYVHMRTVLFVHELGN